MHEMTNEERQTFRKLCDAARNGSLRLVRAFKKDGTPVAVASRTKKGDPKVQIEPIALLSEVKQGELSLVGEDPNPIWRN